MAWRIGREVGASVVEQPDARRPRFRGRRPGPSSRARQVRVAVSGVVGTALVAVLASCAVTQAADKPTGEIGVTPNPQVTAVGAAEQRSGTMHATLTGLVTGTDDGALTCSRQADVDGGVLLKYAATLNPGAATFQFSYKPATGTATGVLSTSPTASYGLSGAATLNLPADLSGGTLDAVFRPLNGGSGEVHLTASLTCAADTARISPAPPAVTSSPTYVPPRFGYSTLTASGRDALQVSKTLNVTCGVWTQPDGSWVATYDGMAPMGDNQVWFNTRLDLATGLLTGTVTDRRGPGGPVVLTLVPARPTVTNGNMRVRLVTGYTVTSGSPSTQRATPQVSPSGSPVLTGDQIFLNVDCVPLVTATGSPAASSSGSGSATPTLQ